MSLDDHDRLIAYVLGLSHALNIAFFTALAESGEAAPKLAQHVEHHVRLAARRGEPRGPGEPGAVFRDPEPERLRRRIARGPLARPWSASAPRCCRRITTAFVALMRRGRDYLEDRRSVAERRA